MSENNEKKQSVKEDKIDPVENKRSTEPVKENKKSSGEKSNKKKPAEIISSETEKIKEDTAFNWEELESSVSKDSSSNYSEKERDKLEKMYAGTMNEISEKEVVKGTVVSVTDRNVILSIGFKSDGLVSISEFRDIPDIKAGDEIDIFIENQEDQNGQLLLSRNKAKIVMGWDKIRDCLKNSKVIDGFVKRRT
ncbi:MAG: S1 RNA-binding domain-containing protein, partial [Bacteroidetes bacterium]|nr:S1 RNA-binding domain-containing protein [Bacteroidota bacterium]